MVCPHCGAENKAGAAACAACGRSLASTDWEGRVQALELGFDTLRQTVTALTARLDAVVPDATPPSAPEATAGQPSAQAPPVTVADNAHGAVVVLIEERSVDTETSVPAPPADGGDRRGGTIDWNWEQIVGGNWLARIGVLAIIVGVAFFLKLAFDNNWIGEAGRVALGLSGGIGMMGLGVYWSGRYRGLGLALHGGGIALLYLSGFAAFALYGLIGIYPATGFLFLVSAGSAGLALRYESPALAVIGVVGGFAAPFLLAGFDTQPTALAAGVGDIQILGYIIVVDLGVLGLSTFRNWRGFTLLSFAGSLAAFGTWFAGTDDDLSLLVPQAGITLIFLVFVGATTLFHVVWHRTPTAFDQALMVANAAAYFGISAGILWEDYRVWMGAFTVSLALFYGLVAYVALRRSETNATLSLFAVGIALVFVTIAVPVQLGNAAWTTIAWAAEGTVLLWLSFILRYPRLRLFGYGAFVLTLGRLFLLDTPMDLRTFTPFFNERVLAYAVTIALVYGTAMLIARGRHVLEDWEREWWQIFPIFVVVANGLTLGILTLEVFQYFDSRLVTYTITEPLSRAALENLQNLSLTGVWAVYAVGLLVVGIVGKWRLVRVAGLALLALPTAKLFVYDVFTLQQVYRISAFVGLGVLLLVGAYLYQRHSNAIRGFLREA